MKNIALISLNTAGTMGHMSLTTRLSKSLSDNRIFLVSDQNYGDYANLSADVQQIIVPKSPQMHTVAGSFSYDNKDSFVKKMKDLDIHLAAFSTFYDPGLVTGLREEGIKTVLMSYPLRDSHRLIMKTRGLDELFDKVLTLKDISDISYRFSNEEVVCMIPQGQQSRRDVDTVRNVLVTCGGGSRPSAKMMREQIEHALPILHDLYPGLNFTIIKGAVDFAELPARMMDWSKDFTSLLGDADLVISEAGYFTVSELVELRKPAILIPGARNIDNQELRAATFERVGCGYSILPSEHPNRLVDLIQNLIEERNLSELQQNFTSVRSELYRGKGIDEAILECLEESSARSSYFGEGKKLHVGCGSNIFQEWINIDIHSGDISVDVREGLPFKDETFKYVFSEHFLEHLDFPAEAIEFLRHCNRVLRPGGVIRIGTPDTEYTIKAYLDKNHDYFDRCSRLWHRRSRTRMESVNHHFRQGGEHKFTYDFETLELALEDAGFVNVTLSDYQKSPHPELRVDTSHFPGTLYVEASKPT